MSATLTVARPRRSKTIKPRVWIKLYEPEFEPKILKGEKFGTFRPWPAPSALPARFDIISCRVWTGRPYRSTQREFASYTICGVYPVVIYNGGMTVEVPEKALKKPYDATKKQHRVVLDQVAIGDGFESWDKMLAWFSGRYDLPFRGIWIYWGPIT
jgi:hypothetical protein